MSEWGYASGVVAALETSLLPPRGPGEPVTASPSAAELLSRVRRSPVYAGLAVGETEDAMHVAKLVESTLAHYARSFGRQCPDARIIDPFLVEYDFRDLSNYLKSKYAGAQRRPVALSRLPEDGVDAYLSGLAQSGNPAERALAGLSESVAVASQGGRLPAFTIDLMSDGALIRVWPGLVEPFRSPLLDAWAAARRRYGAIEAVVRARMSGIEAGAIREHLLSRAAAGPGLEALAESGMDILARVLGELVPPGPGESFDPSAGAVAVQRLAARFDAELERILEPAWHVPFGVERVFVYLWQSFRDSRNLRAVFGGFAGKISPELVACSLRGVHA